jgi:hypothetical protein
MALALKDWVQFPDAIKVSQYRSAFAEVCFDFD